MTFNKSKSVLSEPLLRLSLVWIAQFLLHYCYRDFISPRNESAGMRFENPDVWQLVLWNFIFSLPVLLLPKKWDKPGAIILWYLYIVTILPFGTLTLDMGRDETMNLAVLSFLLPFVLLITLYSFVPSQRPLQIAKIPLTTCTTIFAILSVVGAFVIFYEFRNEIGMSLETVYDRRLEARLSAQSRSIGAYGLAIFAQAVVPVAVALSLTKLSFRNAAIVPAFFGALAIFGFNGTKSSVLTPFIMVLLVVGLAFHWKQGIHLLFGLIALLLVGYGLDAAYEQSVLTEFLARRLFAVPVQLAHTYLEFFSGTDYLYFSDIGFVNNLIGANSPYSGMTAGFIIGEEYFGGSHLNANVGSIPYGFAEMGIAGSWIVCAIIFFLLVLVDRSAINKSPRWTVPLGFAIAFRLSEQALHTALISGGVVFILLVLVVVSEDRQVAATRAIREPQTPSPLPHPADA
jgi:hypothetical protein